ncbi:MAG: lysophospholipid acyltransferase family protein [Candidatus Competibacteraceae bacterium]
MSVVRTGRRLLRISLITLHLLAGILMAWLVLRPRAGKVVSTWPMMLWSRLLCRILGLRLVVHGKPLAGTTLFVANHISWLDIFCIAAVCPTHFLAKSEVATWPLFGWLCRRAGTVFIRRGGDNGAGEAAEQVTWRLHQGSRMAIFPEGTSTTGATVRRFYPRLLQSAIHVRCPVQAIALRYPTDRGINPVVPFVGDDDLLGHLWRLAGEPQLVAELTFCEPLPAAGQSRTSLAFQTHAQISAVLQQPASLQQHPRIRRLRRLTSANKP